MNILQNINLITQSKGITLTEIERACNFSKSSMRKWSENIPSIEKIIKVADYLETSLDFIIYGEEKKSSLSEDEQQLLNNYRKLNTIDKAKVLERALVLSEESRNKKYNAPISDEDLIELPLYDLPVSAGTGNFLDESKAEMIKIPKREDSLNADYMVRVSGDSMEPRVMDGDIVLVKKTEQLNIGDIGIFVINSEAYIKQYDYGRLISINPRYKPIKINNEDTACCMGKVIAVWGASK